MDPSAHPLQINQQIIVSLFFFFFFFLFYNFLFKNKKNSIVKISLLYLFVFTLICDPIYQMIVLNLVFWTGWLAHSNPVGLDFKQ